MRCIGRSLLILVSILVVVALILAGLGVWFVRRPWPQVDGTIAVPGLSAPVDLIRDRSGVPHIYAQNEHDLFFAQGYVHAQDRLWQMEFNRRVGSGTLSAALGEATLDTDIFLRTLGLRRAAEKDWALLDDQTRAILDAYAQGVNAYVDSHHDRLPLEFTILGVDPAPWTPVDTLAWGKVLSYNLCSNYRMELLRAQIIAQLGEQAAQELMPPYPDGAPVIVPPEARSYAWLRGTNLTGLDAIAPFLGDGNLNRGSNSWVVHGSRTATGLPFLADDTHLTLNMPSVWYENGLHGGRFEVVGYSFPGVPLVIIGHNQNIAWGVTNLPADVQDFYIEKLDDPVHPTRYEFDGQWRDLEVVSETIQVANAEPVTLNVLLTHHGPIMNDVIGDLDEAEPLALRWTALDGNRIFQAVALLDLATNWTEFRQAVAYWDAPSQNFVYADLEGNIGYQTPGQIPIRAAGHQGLVPVPGWTGDTEWQGFIPFDELPSVLNPATGFVVTANNKVVPDDYPYHLAYEWSAPYRAQRITDLLAADDRVTLDTLRALHAQTYSIPAELLRPYLLAAQPQNDLQAQALDQVRAWDLYMEPDRPGASVFQVWLWALTRNTLRDELGDSLAEQYLAQDSVHLPVIVDLMAQPDSPWFDDTATPQVETRDDIVQRCLEDAVAWLSDNYGDKPEDWEWGRLHEKTFVHQPLGQSGIRPLETLFNSTAIPARGDNYTVDVGWYAFDTPFAMTGGVSQRYIADLSDWGNSIAIHTTGQSGHLFHRHREDFIPLWQNVDYRPLYWTRPAAEGDAEGVLTLTPP